MPAHLCSSAVAGCVLATVLALTPPAEAAPGVSIKQAVDLAEEALAPKNPDGKVYIESIVLQRTSVFSGKEVWTVNWSSVLPGSKAGSQEVGIEIGMDGSVVHLIKGRGTSKPQALPH